MHKIKYYPDVALLLMRLVAGIGFILLLYPFAVYLMENGTGEAQMQDLIQATILFVGSVLLMLGLYSRWTAAVIVATTLVAGIMSLPPFGDLTFVMILQFLFIQLNNSLIPLSIWLIGAGKYALDYKLWKRV